MRDLSSLTSLQPHAAKSVFTVPTRILSVVAKNQNPGLVAVAHNYDCLRIEIAEINPDVLWLSAGLPPKNARRLRARCGDKTIGVSQSTNLDSHDRA
jgi:hypothetical protein